MGCGRDHLYLSCFCYSLTGAFGGDTLACFAGVALGKLTGSSIPSRASPLVKSFPKLFFVAPEGAKEGSSLETANLLEAIPAFFFPCLFFFFSHFGFQAKKEDVNLLSLFPAGLPVGALSSSVVAQLFATS